MPTKWSVGLQVFILLICLAGSVWIWVEREHVSDALAALRAPADTAGKKQQRRDDQPRPVPVIVEAVANRENTTTITAVGTARAQRATMLTAKSDGEIIELSATAGKTVRAGEPLYRIDETQARLVLQIATEREKEAERALERAGYLKRRNVNSGAPVEDAESALRRAKFERAQAERALGDLTGRAPFAGIVGIAKVELGDRVTTGTEIVSLDDRSTLRIEFEVPERFLPQIESGQEISLTTPSFVNRTFIGTIAATDSRIDPKSRSVTVRALIPNAGDLLRPGMSFSAALTLTGKTYPAVPELALQWRGGDSYIWTVKDEKSVRVPVKTVRRRNREVLVEGPIEAGDLVIVEGVQRLRPNRPVSFTPPAKTEATPVIGQAEDGQASDTPRAVQ